MSKSKFARGLSVVIAVALLALTACTPSAGLTADLTPHPVVSPNADAPATTPVAAAAPVPTPDWSRWLSDEGVLEDPAAANQAMREATAWARDESGLRAQLGAEADEIFRLLDEAQATLVQEMLRQVESAGRPRGLAALFPPRVGPPSALRQAFTYVSIVDLLLAPINAVKWHPNSQTEPYVSEEHVDKELGEGIIGHIDAEIKLIGSRIEADVVITVSLERDGKTYEEKAAGKLSGNVCPDEQGLVPMELDLQMSASYSGGGGYVIASAVRAVGHVDDEANLVTVEEEIQADIAMTRPNIWPFEGTSTENASLSFRSVASGLALDADSIRETSGRALRSNLEVAAAKVAGVLAIWTVELAYSTARSEWRSGCCVALVVPEGYWVVRAGSETTFTANVRHRFEGSDLAVPVVATLESGAGSVTPADTKVPAPATFTYTAPEEEGHTQLKLVSTSRRGIAELKVHFETRPRIWRVNTAIGLEHKVPVTGVICDFEEPFTLDVKGTNPSGGKYEGVITFTPTDADGGTWTHTATSCVGLVGCGEVTANGTYRLEGLAEHAPILKMPATTIKSDIKGHVAVYDWPAWEIVPTPRTD